MHTSAGRTAARAGARAAPRASPMRREFPVNGDLLGVDRNVAARGEVLDDAVHHLARAADSRGDIVLGQALGHYARALLLDRVLVALADDHRILGKRAHGAMGREHAQSALIEIGDRTGFLRHGVIPVCLIGVQSDYRTAARRGARARALTIAPGVSCGP